MYIYSDTIIYPYLIPHTIIIIIIIIHQYLVLIIINYNEYSCHHLFTLPPFLFFLYYYYYTSYSSQLFIFIITQIIFSNYIGILNYSTLLLAPTKYTGKLVVGVVCLSSLSHLLPPPTLLLIYIITLYHTTTFTTSFTYTVFFNNMFITHSHRLTR